MKVLIIGAGIGGLACAGFLERKGFEVTLIERAPEFKHIGFGVTLWENGRKLLQELGVDEHIAAKDYVIPWFELTDKNGRTVFYKNLTDFEGRRDKPAMTIERSALHSALVENLKATRMHLGTTIKEIKNEGDKVDVEFSNDARDTFDLVIAADGIDSQIRREFFGDQESNFYGWSARSFWLPAHIRGPKGAKMLSREKLMIGMFPLRERHFVVMYEYNPNRIDNPPLSIDDFLRYLAKYGWTEKDTQDLEKEAREGRTYYDHLRHVKPGPWYEKRIVLLGDARHGFSPIAGMGANMAIEDGFVLANELAKVGSVDIDAALRNYEEQRTSRLAKVIGLNKFSEKIYFITSPFVRMLRDAGARLIPQRLIGRTLRQVLDRSV